VAGYARWVSEGELKSGLQILEQKIYSDSLKVCEIIAWSKTKEQQDIVKLLEQEIAGASADKDRAHLIAGIHWAKEMIARKLEDN
jgi:hypothetical protein